jgi:D-alanyl-D-alanine carboxypeptidase
MKTTIVAVAALLGTILSAQDIAGIWQGTLKTGPQDLRVIVQISKGEKDGWKATAYSIDEGPDAIPVNSVTLEGSTLKMIVAARNGTYEGKVSADGASINGTWTLGQPLPLNFERVNEKTAWPHDPSPSPHNDVKLLPGQTPPKLTESESAAARTGVPFRQFSSWLDAFNTGDRNRIRQFQESNYPSMNVDQQMNFRDRTGGLEFRALEQATATTLTGLVQERDSDQFGRFTLVVDPAEPHRITRLGILAIPRPAEFPVSRLSEVDAIKELRGRLEKGAATDRYSGTILVANKGKVLFSGAYGLANRENKMANKLDTRFRIGSMNKMFTAVSILQLAQAGKIKLTDPVGKYVSDYPNQDVATKVTIHHLLTHTGGTGDIFGPEFNAHRLELRTLNDYVALYGKRAPAFDPGSRWEYSNYGMLLLGVVVERVSGQSYYDYVARHIYKPAGMTLTGSEPESEAVPDRSIGYMRSQGGGAWTPNTDTLPYRGTSAGGGYSTVGDLMKFADALMGHTLLNAEYTELLITGKVESGGGRMYAYGFEDGRKDGVGAVGHGGGAPGMNGDLRIYPQSGYLVVVLSNLDPPAAQRVSEFLDLRLPK